MVNPMGHPHLNDPATVSELTDEVMGTELRPASQRRGRAGHDPAETAAVRTQAVRLRLAGLSYSAIAEQLGFTDHSQVRNLVVRALNRVEFTAVEEYRDIESARYDEVQRNLWPLVIGPRDPAATGYVPPETRLKAIDSFLRLSKRRADLLGMDAPKRIEVSSGATADVEEALAEFEAVVMGMVVSEGDPEAL